LLRNGFAETSACEDKLIQAVSVYLRLSIFMQPEKEEFDLQLLITDVYVNFERFNQTLKRKYPAAFQEFNLIDLENEIYPFCYFEFFYGFELLFRYKETEAINPNYTGTYSYRIIIDEETAKKLNRKKTDFSYYGINTKQKAVEKMIEKSFEIIDCLLRKKEMPEKLRRL